MNFEETMRALADRTPHVAVSEAIKLVDEGGPALTISLDGVNVRERALWVLEQPDIVEAMESRKIVAIKEVRARTYLGLKEAKDAVVYACRLKEEGYLSLAEREQLARDEEAAIESIRRMRDA